MKRTQETYCSNCGELGHYQSQCPERLKGRAVVVEKPVEVEMPDVCPECGTNLKSKAKRAEYMRRYMARRRK